MRLFNPQRGIINHLLALTIAFGLGTVLFGALAIYSYRTAQQARLTLDSAKQEAKSEGAKEQATLDAEKAKQLAQDPFRSYLAPRNLGGFEIKFPKNWSALIDEQSDSSTQVKLAAHPDFLREGEEEQSYALVVKLLTQKTSTLLRQYNEDAQDKKLTSRAIRVSGLAATWFEGKYDDEHNGVIVLVPVRDKTLTFETQDRQFIGQLNQILAQSKATP